MQIWLLWRDWHWLWWCWCLWQRLHSLLQETDYLSQQRLAWSCREHWTWLGYPWNIWSKRTWDITVADPQFVFWGAHLLLLPSAPIFFFFSLLLSSSFHRAPEVGGIEPPTPRWIHPARVGGLCPWIQPCHITKRELLDGVQGTSIGVLELHVLGSHDRYSSWYERTYYFLL